MLFAKKKASMAGGLSLIPLINIVFLLLLFFLVSGTWRKDSFVDFVTLPSSAERALAMEESVALTFDKGGVWLFEGEAIDGSSIPQALRAAKRVNIYADEAADAAALLAFVTSFAAAQQSVFLITRR